MALQSEDSESTNLNDLMNASRFEIPRTKFAYQQFNLQGDFSSDDENSIDFYRLSPGVPDTLRPIHQMFENKPISQPFKTFDTTIKQQPEFVELPPLIPEGITVYLANITSLLPGKSQNKKCNHSFQELKDSNAVEATRNIASFFNGQYIKYLNFDQRRHVHLKTIDINWCQGLKSYPSQTGSHGLRIFHYIGIGFPPPKDGKLCLMPNGLNDSDWKSINEIKHAFQTNIHFIIDSDKANSLSDYMLTNEKGFLTQKITAMFACGKNEVLHIPETLPNNIFSCILLNPVKALRQLIPNISSISDESLTMLINIFTDAIARETLDLQTFSTLFHETSLISSLWKHFILAQKLMKKFGITVHSIPHICDCSENPLWMQFSYALRCNGDNQLSRLTALYRQHFTMSEIMPPIAVRVFMSSLLKNQDVYEQIMIDIAGFMQKSPLNCSLMAPILEPGYITAHKISQERSFTGARAWNIIISGMLLVLPSFAKSIGTKIEGCAIMNQAKSPKTDDLCRKYLLSSVCVLTERQTHIIGFLGNETTISEYFPLLFNQQTSPETRMMLTALLRIIIMRSQAKPSSSGPVGIHIIAEMLMDDENALIRSLAVSILGFLLYSNAIDFNADVMRIALPAAVDGSFRVRKVFAAMLQRYVEYGGTISSLISYQQNESDDDQSQQRQNSQQNPISLTITDILERKIQSLDDALNEILSFLMNDPSDSVYEEAMSIPNVVQHLGSEITLENLKQVSETIQNLAHASLFSQNTKTHHMQQRYTDIILSNGGLELFEVLEAHENSGNISSLSFDRNHFACAYGSLSGTVVWGNDKWRPCNSPIISLYHVGGDCMACGSSSGYIYILKRGYDDPVDCFQPSFQHPSMISTIIAGDITSTNAFISTGNSEVVQWNLASLKPVGTLNFESDVVGCTVNNNEFVAYLKNNQIVSYDTRSFDLIRTIIPPFNHSSSVILGTHCDKLYISPDIGPCVIYDQGEVLQTIDFGKKLTDFVLHPTLDAGIEISDETIFIDGEFNKISLMNIPNAKAVKCCFDGDRPLAAIGNNDGTVSVWRIPKNNSSF